jgi:hypothetical protein
VISRIILVFVLISIVNVCAFGQTMDVDVAAVKELVGKWNAAHSRGKLNGLLNLYADTVGFYGSMLTPGECVSKKKSSFEVGSGFHQAIGKDLLLSAYEKGVVRSDFVSVITRGDGVEEEHSYLIVKEINGEYRIVEESNLATDRKLRNYPYYGAKVGIIDTPLAKPSGSARSDLSYIVDLLLIIVTAVLAIVLLSFAIAKWRRGRRERRHRVSTLLGSGASSWRKIERRSQRSKGRAQLTSYGSMDAEEKGLDFEKYVVKQFDRHFFTLMDWRGDKFHEGIYPKSSRNPDLVYEFRIKDTARKFAIECKFRSRLINDSVTLMSEEKYNIYKAYHQNSEPVYIALGLGGTPYNPEKFYLIPFSNVKLEMSLLELAPWRKHGREFYYDLEGERVR